MLRVSQLSWLLAAFAAHFAAYAAPCPEADRGTLDEWKCFGQVEFAARTEGQPDFGARFVFFDGAERLYEKRAAEGVKLMLRGDSFALYRGLEETDSTVIGGHNPFLFFEFALIVPVVALSASGNAPSALPAGTTRVRYDGGGKAAGLMMEIGIRAVEGTIERQGAEYAFIAQLRTTALVESPLTSVRGHWSSAAVAPYPDSMPVAGWQYGCPRPQWGVDVRGNHRIVPNGVTLGDVRRGWRGPCD